MVAHDFSRGMNGATKNLEAIFTIIGLRSVLGFLEMTRAFTIIMIPTAFSCKGSAECDRRNYI